jgi:hypothetical protein
MFWYLAMKEIKTLLRGGPYTRVQIRVFLRTISCQICRHVCLRALPNGGHGRRLACSCYKSVAIKSNHIL